MRSAILVILVGLVLAGCDKSVDNDEIEHAFYGEEAMFQTTQLSDALFAGQKGKGICYDSTRHAGMLQAIANHLGLSESQTISLNGFGQTLYSHLLEIRRRIREGEINKPDARPLVKAAREEFMNSLRSILTPAQETLLAEWKLKLWERKKFRRGHFGG